MNFLEKIKKKKKAKLLAKQEAVMKKLDDFMKEADNDAYRLAHLISEVVNGGKGYMIMATMLADDQGNDVLRHQAVISKGFKMEDVIPTCEEQKKLAENAIKQNEEYLKERAGENSSTSPSPAPTDE